MTKKQKIDQMINEHGQPFMFGNCLTSLSIAQGWNTEKFIAYRRLMGDTDEEIEELKEDMSCPW